MDDTTRRQMVAELEALRAQVRAAGDAKSGPDVALIASVNELDALVRAEHPSGEAHTLARALEERLLAWEAEHPKLVAFASRVAHALEDSGI
jgi:hypothetical protein